MPLTMTAPTVAAETMETLIDAFLTEHVAQLSIAAEMRGTIRNYFGPLRAYALADITPLIVEAWFHAIGKKSHAMANKSLSILRTIF